MENIIEIDNVKIPYTTNEKGELFYPIRYIFEKYLLKSSFPIHKKEEYKPYIQKLVIDWSFKGTTPQEANCMNTEGWKYYFNNCKSNSRKTDDKVKRFNLLCDYFECEENKISKQIKEYNEYEKRCIDDFVRDNKDIEFSTCIRCNREFPLSNKFFMPDERSKTGVQGICKSCKGCNFHNEDEYITKIYKTFGIEGYSLYIKDIIQFYNAYCHNKDFKFKCKDENEGLQIIKWYYDNKLIKSEHLEYDYIKDFFNFNIKLKTNIINEHCEPYKDCNKPYELKNYDTKDITLKQANVILDNYIEDNNIIIEDILNYKGYTELIRKSKLYKYTNDSLDFIVQYFGKEFAGYKFKLRSKNYYRKKENRIFDLKWFIEKDLKVEINKIPLYITKYALHHKARPLYDILRNGYYYKSLFEWIDECYPDMFNINDFEVNPYRAEFDSLEEAQIDEYLRNQINKSVLYNGRTNRDVIEIEGMIPDWIIHTNKGCYLVEYFGLYQESNYENSHRLIKYHEKMKVKMEKYKELEKVGYKTLFIYPDDIRNGFDGLLEKLQQIKN